MQILVSAGIYLLAKENTGKPQLGDRLTTSATSHRLKWGPFLPNDVGRIVQYLMKREIERERERERDRRNEKMEKGMKRKSAIVYATIEMA